MSKPKFKIGDRVWTGAFYRGRQNELKVAVIERDVVEVIPNYLDKLGLRYCLVNVAKLPDIRATIKRTGETLRMFGAAYKPEAVFATECDARNHIHAQVTKELVAIRNLLGELPDLATGEIHSRTP